MKLTKNRMLVQTEKKITELFLILFAAVALVKTGILTLEKLMELMVVNPLYPKHYKPETHGTGLSNLDKRFTLLMNRQIRVEQTANEYKVILPLG